ncbi:MAG: signal recognition particle protein, partial [Eubacteriales bacterium]|nr:signal recognition particle protein [Eubacteriales bacterium]
LDMLPGMNSNQMKNVDMENSEKEFIQMEAIIQSMTKEERKNPDILNASRRKRISAGSGQPVSRINNLIRKYEDAKKMMKQFSNAPKFKRSRMFKGF